MIKSSFYQTISWVQDVQIKIIRLFDLDLSGHLFSNKAVRPINNEIQMKTKNHDCLKMLNE